MSAIDKKGLADTLLDFSEWKKIIPDNSLKTRKNPTIKEFREKEWISGGIFGDFIEDDLAVYPLATTGKGRLYQPIWEKKNCVNCELCIKNCPNNAITKDENNNYTSDDNKCIGCSICKAVCPRQAWTMQNNQKEIG